MFAHLPHPSSLLPTANAIPNKRWVQAVLAAILVVSLTSYWLIGFFKAYSAGPGQRIAVSSNGQAPSQGENPQGGLSIAKELEKIRLYRSQNFDALGLPRNTTVDILPAAISKLNLSVEERLFLEPSIMQILQWACYEDIIINVPGWINSSLASLDRSNYHHRRLDPRIIHDRYATIVADSEQAMGSLQNLVLCLQDLSIQSTDRLHQHFVLDKDVIRIVGADGGGGAGGNGNGKSRGAGETLSYNSTWTENIRRQVADSVKHIEASKDEVFDKLHKSGHAKLETVIRVAEDEVLVESSDFTAHESFGSNPSNTIVDSYNNRYVLARPENLATINQEGVFIGELLKIFVLALLFGFLFEKLSLPPFLGYLVSGMVLGASCLDQVQNLVQTSTIGQFFLMLMMYGLGLEFSMEKIMLFWKKPLVATTILTAGSMLAFATLGTFVFDIRLRLSLFTGFAVSFSSTVIAINYLKGTGGRNAMSSSVGSTVSGVLMVQDFFLCIALAILPVLRVDATTNLGSETLWEVFGTLSLLAWKIAVYTVFVLFVSKAIMHKSSRVFLSNRTVPLAFAFICSWVAMHIGIGTELGAFLAGISIAANKKHDGAGKDLDASQAPLSTPSELQSIFFFASVGLLIDVRFMWEQIGVLIALAILISLLKTLLVALVMRSIFRMELRDSLSVAFNLAQVSELVLLLGARGRSLNVITSECYYIIVGVTTICVCISSLVFKAGRAVDSLWSCDRGCIF